jgi:hypothetical protein
MWNEEVKRHGLEDASLKRVIWKFIRSRVLINIILYLSSILFGFIGPVNNIRILINSAVLYLIVNRNCFFFSVRFSL